MVPLKYIFDGKPEGLDVKCLSWNNWYGELDQVHLRYMLMYSDIFPTLRNGFRESEAIGVERLLERIQLDIQEASAIEFTGIPDHGSSKKMFQQLPFQTSRTAICG